MKTTKFQEKELVSNCCSATDCGTSEDGPYYSDIGLCPQCKEHCEFVELKDEE